MACRAPLPAWQTVSGDIVFVERGDIKRSLMLACGQCFFCRLERSRQWATRCMHEASLHEVNSFVTLTYDEAHWKPSLEYRDFQLFMKRLRKRFECFDVTLWQRVPRFYMAGEYGSQFGRPHFHACLFGIAFPDREIFRHTSSGFKLYRSALLDSLWDSGYASVGDVTYESAAYVARYIIEKVTGKRAAGYYSRVDPSSGECISLTPEFNRMSLKPGVGRRWIEKFTDDVYDQDYVIVNGMKCRPPKYYDNVLKDLRPDSFEHLEVGRVAKSIRFIDDNTPERLAVRETVARARLAFKRRSLE